MTPKERWFAIMEGKRPDRFPYVRSLFWDETIKRWQREGMPAGADPNDAIGLDFSKECYAALPINFAFVPLFEYQLVADEGEKCVIIDSLGITQRILKEDLFKPVGGMSTMSQWLEYPVKDRASWEKIREERLRPDSPARDATTTPDVIAKVKEYAKDRIISIYDFPFLGTFGTVRQLVGFERLVYLFYDDPDFVRTILTDLVTYWKALLSRYLDKVHVDCVGFFEDMCGKQGPIISPALFREFFAPVYEEMTAFFRSFGVTHFYVDTDGNARGIIPEFKRVGVDIIHPCEVQAGMEADELLKEFPDMRFMGGMDKRALAKDKKAIDEELRKRYTTAWKTGRYLPYFDHLLPPDIPWENFKYYGQVAETYLSGKFL